MTNLSDLFSTDDLAREISDGYVRARSHPQDHGLFIFNYTEKAQFDRHWNDVTLNCRGLIAQATRDGDGLIVSRPWPKFFNYGQGEVGLPVGADFFKVLEAPATVQDKLDGSLGILYPAPDGDWAIATRGSFESEQAIHATEVFRTRYEDYWAPNPRLTYLFEIVYPANRIVVDYGDLDDLVLLDVIYTGTGQSLRLAAFDSWPGPVAENLPARNLAEALRLPDRENREGIVVSWMRPGEPSLKLKIKQEDYVALHRIVTGLNERAVWEYMSANEGSIDGLLDDVPDELHSWLHGVHDRLLDAFEEIQGRAHAAYHGWRATQEEWGEDWSRRDFARWAQDQGDLTPLLFMLLDGRPLDSAIWKRLRPAGVTESARPTSEETA